MNPLKFELMAVKKMETGLLHHRKLVGIVIGGIIGALVCIILAHPWIGVVVGVTIGTLFGNNMTLWKEGARRGAITGSIVTLIAGFVTIPPRIGQSGFAFWDSFFFYLILGVIGSAVVGGLIGALIT